MPREKSQKKKDNALDSIWRKHYEGRPDKIAALEQERLNAHIAHAIYNLRKAAGLTQRQLAKMVNTQASAISRLENADYNGRSLTMLNRIVALFSGKLSMSIVPANRSHTYFRTPDGERMSIKEQVLA